MSKSETEKYKANLIESLSKKINLKEYNHYNNLIKCRNDYISMYEKYRESKLDKDIVPRSEENVFGYIFNISTHFFNELLNSIILSQYDSAHFSIRRIAENYIICSLLQKNLWLTKTFFDQIEIRKYNHMTTNAFIKSKLTTREISIIESNYNEIRNRIIEFYELEEPLSGKQENKLNQILSSDYAWTYELFKFGDRITLKKIAELAHRTRDYVVVGQSSNRVHSNNIIEYSMILSSDYREEEYLAGVYLMYMSHYVKFIENTFPNVCTYDINITLNELDSILLKKV